MKRRDPHHKELTNPENEKFIGTLTPRAWAKLTVLATRADFYGLNVEELRELTKKGVDPVSFLLHEARQSSGSILGEHRKDIVEALKASSEGKEGVGLGLDDLEREGGL